MNQINIVGNRIVHLLVLLVVLTLWRRSHAGQESTDGAGFRNMENLAVPSRKQRERVALSNGTEEESPSCTLPAPPRVEFRGGFRDHSSSVAGVTTTPATTLKEQLLQSRKKVSKKASKYQFSLFQPGDGSETDPDGIPARYHAMHPGDRAKALEAVQATLEWREKHAIDTCMDRPRTNFDVAKAVFPHYFAGRDKGGHVVFVQRPGLLSLELAKKNGLSKEDLLEHYVFVNEYLWQVIEEKEPLGMMLGILDLQGLNMKALRQKEVINFLKLFVATMDSHFPQRAHKTMIVNAPKWFNLVYKLISPLLRESTKAKIEILSRGKKQDKALKSRIGDKAEKVLPKSFFSEKKQRGKRKRDEESSDEKDDRLEIPETDLELKFRAFVSLLHSRVPETHPSCCRYMPV